MGKKNQPKDRKRRGFSESNVQKTLIPKIQLLIELFVGSHSQARITLKDPALNEIELLAILANLLSFLLRHKKHSSPPNKKTTDIFDLVLHRLAAGTGDALVLFLARRYSLPCL